MAVKQKVSTGAAPAPEPAPQKTVTVSPPKFQHATITIRGISPLVQHKFSEKAQAIMREKQESGSLATKGKKREPKDFHAVYEAACHRASDRFGGWYGIPASAFRNAMISACRVIGFKMTIAKMSVFCVADGYDDEGTGLVKITKGEPQMFVSPARNQTGVIDLRARPKWDEGWEAQVTLRWDSDQFSASDIVNLLSRVGLQVGVGEGRADSRESAGCGWGEFEIMA